MKRIQIKITDYGMFSGLDLPDDASYSVLYSMTPLLPPEARRKRISDIRKVADEKLDVWSFAIVSFFSFFSFSLGFD